MTENEKLDEQWKEKHRTGEEERERHQTKKIHKSEVPDIEKVSLTARIIYWSQKCILCFRANSATISWLSCL